MPYKSLAQERYFNANKAKLEKQGVNVNEWNSATKGKKLPMKKDEKEKVHNKKEEKAEKFGSKGMRTKLNNAAEKTMFRSKYSK